MERRTEIINQIVNNSNYVKTCKNIAGGYHKDVYQEVCEQVLIMPIERLPKDSYLPFWFYCVARNVYSKHGKIGKIINKEIVIDFTDNRLTELIEDEIESNTFADCEDIMLSLSEFENRIVLLYAKHGSMKEVEKETGISYSALRKVKDKIKGFR
jgi:DNA-directed RNA polymerase specialized sigma24 family protein